MSNKEKILSVLREKGELKQKVFDNTFDTFSKLKIILTEIEKDFNSDLQESGSRVSVEYKNNGLFQCELRIAGDLLIFYMHTNVFEFDREHKIWTLPSVQQDKYTSYCGIISIYNFLADSFKYQRNEDYGYLIARLFINKENCYFVEGKQQSGYLSNDFGKNVLTKELLRGIIEMAILYSQKFDLLVPPYDSVKILNVAQVVESRKEGLQIGKRMGFSFNSDDISGEKLLYTGA